MAVQSKKPEKHWYSVKIEAMVPTTITYKVLAESPEDAVKLITQQSPSEPPRFKLSHMKRISAAVYKAGTCMLKFSKRF